MHSLFHSSNFKASKSAKPFSFLFFSNPKTNKKDSKQMKLLPLLLLLLITTTLHLILSCSVGYSSSTTMTFVKAGRSLRGKTPTLEQDNGQKKTKVLDVETKQTSIQEEESTEHEYSSSGDDSNELVYHVDYHGVTTHPSPLPKHPRP